MMRLRTPARIKERMGAALSRHTVRVQKAHAIRYGDGILPFAAAIGAGSPKNSCRSGAAWPPKPAATRNRCR